MDNLSWKSCLKAAVSLFLLWLATTYWHSAVHVLSLFFSAASPLLIGLVIAYILNLLMSYYESLSFFQSMKFSQRRILCMFLAMISFITIVAGIFGLVVPELTECLKLLFAEIPGFIDELLKSPVVQQLLPSDITNDLAAMNLKEFLNKIAPVLSNGITTIGSLVSTVFSTAVTFLLSLIFSIYLLLSKETLQKQISRVFATYMNPDHVLKLRKILAVFDDCFHRYMVGQCTEAVILGALCALGMFILRLPYAAMIGTLIGFTALIPVAGAYIGAGVGALMIITVSPVQTVLFLVFIVVLQQIEGNLIYPKVVGNSLGLPAIWVLGAVTIGGGVMGVTGMLLGVPLAAAFYRLIKEDVTKREQSILLSQKQQADE